jgi:hypothetical protein
MVLSAAVVLKKKKKIKKRKKERLVPRDIQIFMVVVR